MKIEAALHADHQLDQLAGQFEHWRQHRNSPRERIPKTLWDQAVALTPALSPSRVAKHLRLGLADLKQHIARHHERDIPHTPPGFIEVMSEGLTLPPPPAPAQIQGSLEVELQRTDGARLRIHSSDASLPLSAIIHSFLEAR